MDSNHGNTALEGFVDLSLSIDAKKPNKITEMALLLLLLK